MSQLSKDTALRIAPKLEANRATAHKVAEVLIRSGDNYGGGSIMNLIEDLDRLVGGLAPLPSPYE